MPLLDTGLRLLLALFLGAVVGAERQWRQRLAGLRTNALVSVGAAMFTLLATLVDNELSPTRVAAQVVSGVGFLGAGVIFKEGLNVRGLNTAATLWCTAAVGVLVGTGFVAEATLGAFLVLGAHLALRPIGRFINRQPDAGHEQAVHYHCRIATRGADEPHVRMRLLQAASVDGLLLRSLASRDVEDRPDGVEVVARFVTEGRSDRLLERVVGTLSLEPAVTAARWEVVEDDG
ncbi:MAG: MgtC/SapB family protein [Rubricoccaceae bacterium]